MQFYPFPRVVKALFSGEIKMIYPGYIIKYSVYKDKGAHFILYKNNKFCTGFYVNKETYKKLISPDSIKIYLSTTHREFPYKVKCKFYNEVFKFYKDYVLKV